MVRVVQFLAGITVAAAASTTVTCQADKCQSCTSVGGANGNANVCVTYDAPKVPTCNPACGGGLGSPACSAVAAGASADTSCQICVPVVAALGTIASVCATTSVSVAPYLTAQSSFEAGLTLLASVTPGASVFADAILVANSSSSQNATVTVTDSSVVVVAADVNAVTAFNTGNSNNDNVIVQVNGSLQVNAWNSNANSVKVNNNNAATLTVGGLSLNGGMFSVWQDSGSSVVVNSLDFSGSSSSNLQVSGGSASFGAQASGSASSSARTRVNVTGSGTIVLSGGVSVDGNFPATVTLNVSGSGSSAPVAVVDSGDYLIVAGNVRTNSDAQQGAIAVNGNLVVSGSASTTIDPRVVVNSAASFIINSSAAVVVKSAEIKAGAKFVVTASADKTKTKISNFVGCLGTVQVKIDTTASAFISGSSAGAAYAFSYDAQANATALSSCAVQVVDSTGATFTLTSKVAGSAAAGRRLLEDSGTATWGSDSMSVQMTKSQTAGATSVSLAVLPLLVVGAIGLSF